LDIPILSKFTNLPVLKTTMRVDAMYLHAARTNFDLAIKQERKINTARRQIEKLNIRRDMILKRHDGDEIAAYDQLEPLYIQMESADYRLGEAHGPQLQAFAMVHILAAAALESHINIQAAERLTRGIFNLIERFSLEAKWITIPRLFCLPGFDIGSEPYQSFSKLVNYRNSLIHYKPHIEDWKSPGVPIFLSDLGLTQKAAEKSLQAATAMISQLAKQFGDEKPFWISRTGINYFEITVD
jgi:hypothetical protein